MDGMVATSHIFLGTRTHHALVGEGKADLLDMEPPLGPERSVMANKSRREEKPATVPHWIHARVPKTKQRAIRRIPMRCLIESPTPLGIVSLLTVCRPSA